MNKKFHIAASHISAVVFLFILFSAALLTFAVPKEAFSQEENKYLAEFPKLSLDALADKSFMDKFEDYASDHFPNRPGWIGLQTRALLAIGQKEVNGVYILPDRLLEHLAEPEGGRLAASTQAMNRFAQRFPGQTFLMLAPTAAEIYRSTLPDGAPALMEKNIIDQVYDGLEEVIPIDVYSSLSGNREDSIYYRMDHHWTSRGAYLGYSALSRELGYTPVAMDLFNVEHASHSFRGSLYSKVIYDGIEPDTIDIYSYSAGPAVTGVRVFDGAEWTDHDSLYFREFLDKKDQYGVFLGQNQPIVTITTDAPGDKRLLVFKDSYAHSLAPFLALHYSEITLVDLRYLNTSFERYVDLSRYGQALFCYNMKNFTSEDHIQKVNF